MFERCFLLVWRNLFYFLSYCVDELEPIANKNIGYEKVSNLLDLLGTLLVESFSLAYKDELYNNEVFINDILDNPYGRINWLKVSHREYIRQVSWIVI